MGNPLGFVWLETWEDHEARRAEGKYVPYDSKSDFNEAASREGECVSCGQHIWRHVGKGVDLCFVCCTGETDASEDFEVGPRYGVEE